MKANRIGDCDFHSTLNAALVRSDRAISTRSRATESEWSVDSMTPPFKRVTRSANESDILID
uniref:Uncharacterized protein n=1 Tax=Hyaloperonospora arabidopsidis (strain Emoy2) TaxID=559515 RepID=M4C6N4_HYAAE